MVSQWGCEGSKGIKHTFFPTLDMVGDLYGFAFDGLVWVVVVVSSRVGRLSWIAGYAGALMILDLYAQVKRDRERSSFKFFYGRCRSISERGVRVRDSSMMSESMMS